MGYFTRSMCLHVTRKGWPAVINETLAVIRQRRSIRQFETRQISDKELNAILDAALFAPTDMNQQKWHFAVVQSKSSLEKMDRIARENKLNSNIAFIVKNAERDDYHTYYHAPTVVVVSGDKQAKSIQIDCGAAAQNIVLAAESMEKIGFMYYNFRWFFVCFDQRPEDEKRTRHSKRLRAYLLHCARL